MNHVKNVCLKCWKMQETKMFMCQAFNIDKREITRKTRKIK